jgi:DNA-binding beta-propeller fold protein YncE
MTLKTLLLASFLAPGYLSQAAQAATPPYTITKSIPLGAPDRWDYLSFDAASNRVMVAHADHTDIVDATTGAILGRLEGLKGAHGQTVAADHRIYADSGKSREITGFDAQTFQRLKTLAAGEDADAVIYEPTHQIVVVLNRYGQSATLVDTVADAIKSTVPLGGAPEFATAEGTGAFYVNIASTREIVRVDAGNSQVTARWPIPDCQSPHGLAMDPKTRRLFTTCVNARLLIVDADTGNTLQTLPIGHGTDAAAFDPVHHLVLSSNGEGTLSVFHESGDGTLTALGDIKTLPGARTMATDPRTGRVFLVTAEIDPVKPVTQGPQGPRYAWKPGSVKLLFLDRASR